MYKNITGIILSGGKSSRMGENKSLMKLGETTVIEHTVQLMKEIFEDVILITNNHEDYQQLNVPIFKDVYKNKGPLAGIHSGMVNSKTDSNFIISCDMPLISKDVVEHIINFKTKKPITLCEVEGFIQQLAAVYSKSLLPIIENILANEKRHSVFAVLDRVEHEVIAIEKSEYYMKDMFLNMNRPEDYRKILSKINLSPK